MMHLVHIGTTVVQYSFTIKGKDIKLNPNTRYTTVDMSARDDMEKAVASYPGDLQIVYDGLMSIDATVGAGSATPTATATGLLATDTVLSATQKTKGASNLPLLGFGAPGAGTIPLVYSADPGANGVVRLLIQR